jgi:DeoR/GlpR family transcriptional regulator of sugar metabolism
MLAALHSVSTDRVASELGVSRETVRRDLIALEGMGALRRTHGGATSTDAMGAAPSAQPVPLTPRGDGRHPRAIARAAAGLLSNGQTLFMEAGGLALHMADALTVLHGLTLITNSFEAAMRVCASTQHSAHGNRAVVLGGVANGPLAATLGDQAIGEIHRYTADAALLFPSGVEARHGATHGELERAELGRAMAANARRVIVLADDERIGRSARVSYCAADRVATLVTNRKAEATEGYDGLAATVGNVVLA